MIFEFDKPLLERLQRHALAQFLSDWESTLTYDEVLDILRASDGEVTDERILVWLPFAAEHGEDIANYILDLHEVLYEVAKTSWQRGVESVEQH